jgi:hypothetical protein
MTPHVESDLLHRVAALEARCSRLWTATVIALLVGAALGLAISPNRVQAQSPDVLTARGLSIVDERGTERVRIGAPLPDPISQGKRVRGMAWYPGILLFDAEGDERGGYVTEQRSGDVFLTLDAKGTQQAVFLANRDGGTNLAVWSGPNRNDNYVSVRAVPRPMIEIVEGGKAPDQN